MRNDEPVVDDSDAQTTRRRFLTATAGLTAAAVAGCPGATDRTFEATPVVLPEDARRELGLGEVLRDSRTTTRQVEAVDGEVTLTSYAAAYTREEAYDLEGADYAPQPTLVERFLGRVNGTNGPGAGRVVAGSTLDVDEVTVGVGGEQFRIPSNRFSLVVPAGAAGENAQPIPSSVFGLGLLGREELAAVPEGIGGYVAPAADVLPDGEWYPGGRSAYQPSRGWFPGSGRTTMDWPTADTFWHDAPTAVVLGDNSPEEVFGVPAEEMPGERMGGSTNPFDTGNNPFLVAIPGDAFIDYPNGEISVGRLLDADLSGPLPGAGTYGVGVLSTPNASVAGQSANPLAGMPLADLVTSDAAKQLVGEVAFPGLVYEWVDGPTVVGDVPDGTEFADASLLGEDAETTTLGGVAHGGPGPFPWFVLVNVARVATEDSAVVAAGVQRTPVAGGYPWLDELAARSTGNNPFLDWARDGAEMTARSGGTFRTATATSPGGAGSSTATRAVPRRSSTTPTPASPRRSRA